MVSLPAGPPALCRAAAGEVWPPALGLRAAKLPPWPYTPEASHPPMSRSGVRLSRLGEGGGGGGRVREGQSSLGGLGWKGRGLVGGVV